LMFEKWGCKKILFQPYAANPYTFTPRWCDPIHSVCFIGSPYGSRVNKLNLLTKSKIDCDVYSDTLITPKSSQKQDAEKSSNIKFSDFINQIACALSFKIGHKLIYSAFKNKYLFKNNSELDMNDFLNAYSSVTFEDMQVIYSNSLLSLNITELRNTYILKNPIHKIHLRTFEIPMCGGLEIASYTDELAGYFEDGKEIVLYKTDEEFISKTKFYLDPSNSTQVFKMKKKARLRAENDHTWMKRFQNIFDNL